jgi:hypothetical protein
MALAVVGLISFWFTDYRFNREWDAYVSYWESCILGSQHSVSASLRLLAKFLWGWHGQMPLLTAFVVPLQLIGVVRILSPRKSKIVDPNDEAWGSRSYGSVFLLGGLIAASALFNLPICAGRVVLFAQIHTQILAVEGAIWITERFKKRAATVAIFFACISAMAYGVRTYWRFVRAEPAENLRPAVALMTPASAKTVWVHPCSIAQVKSLPDRLPVDDIVFGSETQLPQAGERSWIIWSHLGEGSCVRQLDRVQSRAKSWEIIYKGPDSGLALAQF